MSLFFVNALAEPAGQFFLTNYSPNMPFDRIASVMRFQYNFETRMVQIQSEIDIIYLESFMTKKNMPESPKGLTRLVEPIKTLALQFPKAFSYDGYKTRCLRRAAMRLD